MTSNIDTNESRDHTLSNELVKMSNYKRCVMIDVHCVLYVVRKRTELQQSPLYGKINKIFLKDNLKISKDRYL